MDTAVDPVLDARAIVFEPGDAYVHRLEGRFPVRTPDRLEAARAFLAARPDLFDVAPDLSDLELLAVREGLSGTYARFRRLAGGLPVFGDQLVVHVAPAGSESEVRDVVLSRKDLRGWTPPGTAPLDRDRVIDRARVFVGAEGAQRAAPEATLGVLLAADGPRRIWRVDIAAAAPPADWRVEVDASTGEIVEARDRRVFVDGEGLVFDPSPVASTGDTSLTDDGDRTSATLDAARTLVTLPHLDGSGSLRGTWVDAANASGRANEPSLSFRYDRSDDRFEEVMAYYHLDRAQARIQALGFTDANARVQVVDVNGTTQDNSWYSPSTKVITYGTGGVDDAEDGDIVVHEYGHAVQDDQVPDFGGGDQGAMGEGFGDYLGSSIADVQSAQVADILCVGDWDAVSYATSNPPCLRRLDSPKHYPEFRMGEVHADGEMWAAALWGTRARIGADAMDSIVIESHFPQTTSATFLEGLAFLQSADRSLYGGIHADAIRRRFLEQGLSRDLTPSPDLVLARSIPVSITHPTSNGRYRSLLDDTQSYRVAGAAGLRVHFDAFDTEANWSCLDGGCDNVYLFDGDGDLFAIYSGRLGAFDSAVVPGGEVRVRLVTDDGTTATGYHIDRVDVMRPPCVDADGDGVTDCEGDCDDADAGNYPGNAEVCDGRDNNCDGVVDDGLAFRNGWPDADGDGHGDASADAIRTCDALPDGFVTTGDDCDDGSAAVHPGAAEVTCNGVDDDCGATTPDDPDADADGVSLCAGDCDDADGANFPGNAEVCDGRDNDCDGLADDGLDFIDSWPDADGDGYGTGLFVPISTCDGVPEGFVANDDDCNDESAAVHPGAVDDTCDGVDDDCSGIADDHAADADGDGVCDARDACPGDAANDADGDGVCGDVDDCPAVANPAQTDSDHDGVGDACDASAQGGGGAAGGCGCSAEGGAPAGSLAWLPLALAALDLRRRRTGKRRLRQRVACSGRRGGPHQET